MMLNEWSDREPDPPRRSGFVVILGFIVAAAALAFLAQIVLLVLSD